ncbi:LysR family transcriptional regulator [Actinomadura barringtoniae]|uniref:LysR family transcriptional regulator n=1 Tax=Actinomadura barringtoniae TaxID=1427535 RepID=A0A939PIS9_9ACTN|nr:LysR substrate-binding domain-containing protein [Actinomadura barringtoniae]MBO2450843.1 LysR family transcriptional regulator [Actinomadura barringtoniae]
MELRRLRYFAVLAEELHFARAAERLHIAQPSLSQQIKALERELGVRLLDRGGRGVTLTSAGEALVDEAAAVLTRCDELVERVRAAGHGLSGRLRIAYTRSAVDLAAQPIVGRFREAVPGVEVLAMTGWTSENLRRLVAGEVDVVFVRPPVSDAGLAVRQVAEEELVVVVPAGHRWAARRRIKRAELRDEPVVMWPRAQGPGYYDHIVEQVWAGTPPRIVRREPEAESILAAVNDGVGIAVLDRGRAEKLRPRGVLVRRFAAPAPTAGLAIAWRPADRSPALARFLELLPMRADDRNVAVT